jgi:predicted acylesterase/phospholipase RssA
MIEPASVKYLSFGGGGGKGAAYFGAIQAFCHPQVNIFFPDPERMSPNEFTSVNNPRTPYVINCKKIKGIAGASAGAIIAALIATGVPYLPIFQLLTNNKGLLSQFKDEKSNNSFYGFDPTISTTYKDTNTVNSLFYWKRNSRIATKAYEALLELSGSDNNLDFGEEPALTYENIVQGFGYFPGLSLRTILNAYIAKYGFPLNKSRGGERPIDITFAELLIEKGIELVITGTNLLKPGKSQYFSVRTVPTMRIVDAVRISASIPPFFEPVTINEKNFEKDSIISRFRNSGETEFLKGMWIDGGVTNNNPIHVFDYDAASEPIPHSRGTLNKNMLGFTLQNKKAEKPENIFSYFFSIIDSLATNTTTLQILNENEGKRIIEVPVGNLRTEEFVPSYGDLTQAIKLANKHVLTELGIQE